MRAFTTWTPELHRPQDGSATGGTRRYPQLRRSPLLAAGLAGTPSWTGGTLLYDERQVDRLLDRPMCEPRVLDAIQPFIARLGRTRTFDSRDSWETQAAVVRHGWYVPMLTAVRMMRLSLIGAGRCAFVATLGGFAVFGAEIVGLAYDATGVADVRSRNVPNRSFDLSRPGDWYSDVRDAWLPIGADTTPTIWGAPTTTPSKVDSLRPDYERRLILTAIGDLTESRDAVRAAAARAARPPDRR